MRRKLPISLSLLAGVAVAACAPPEPLGTRGPSRIGSQDSESTAAATNSTSKKGNGSTAKQGSGTSTTTGAPITTTPTPTKGCNGGAEKASQASGLSANLTLQVAGNARTYDLEVPDGYDPDRAYPIVFVFHGSGGNGGQVRESFNFADIAGDKALFVYPNGNNREWDLDSPVGDNQDVALFDALVDRLATTYCVDSSRIFATGFSNGAYFSNQLGCTRGDRLRAIASHGGGGPYGPDSQYDSNGNLKCAGPSPAALIVHGTADPVVAAHQADLSLDHWTWADGCDSGTHAVSPSPCAAFNGCNVPVESCRISGLGHSLWSQGAKTTWDFFASL